MIIPALNAYYERLANDDAVDIAPFGFSRQKIAFQIVIAKDGTATIQDAREQSGKKMFPRQLIVPGGAKPPGSGINPCFLWDNTGYVLGFKPDDSNPARTLDSFSAFRDKHLKLDDEIANPHFSLVCQFLKVWNPGLISEGQQKEIADIGSGFCVFRVQGETCFVHDQPAIRKWWVDTLNSEPIDDVPTAPCLTTGLVAPIARIHEPKIKGVSGAQSSGASIVSFNFDAAESYGKEQGFNAPVSQQAAFQYSTALNRLLNSKQRIQIGDATTVFWTEQPTAAETWLPFTFGSMPSEDEGTRQQLSSILQTIRAGGYPDELGDKETDFYILGLSPNAARISIRFWFQSSLGNFVESLGTHYRDLEIVGPWKDSELPSLRQLVDEIAPLKNGKPDRDKIPPNLAGSLTRSVLFNQPYPDSIHDLLLRRIRADGFVNVDKVKNWKRSRYFRASLLKAITNRKLRLANRKELMVNTHLDKLHPSSAYQCGRLMGVLAFIQEKAIEKINSTIVRRYLSAVSSSPALHLGRLQVQAEIGHLPKLPGHLPTFLRDEIKAINNQLSANLPTRLDAVGQSIFVLGFYHESAFLDREVLEDKLKQDSAINLRTDRGEWVRSSGEVQTANCLNQLQVDYHYEPTASLDEGFYRRPDFFVMGATTADNKFIEYLGMDDPKYNDRWEAKSNAYLKKGITPEGGKEGTLHVIDCRKKRWDDVRMLSQLKEWLF